MAIVLVAELAVQVLHAGHRDIGVRARGGIAVMLAKTNGEAAPRHLHKERGVGTEARVPVELEAEKIEIELTRLLERKNTEKSEWHTQIGLSCDPPFSRGNPAFVAPGGEPRYVLLYRA